MPDLTPVPLNVYIDEPMGDVPFIDASCINPSEYTRANHNLWDAPHERAYEWVEDRWVEASEADRLRQQLAHKKNLHSIEAFIRMPRDRL